MSEALKSCPFCGSPAELRQGHLILCMNEEENGCLVDPLVQSLTDEETVAAWNTRPVEDALVEALNKLRKEVQYWAENPRPDEWILQEWVRNIDAALKLADK